jgi:hypothetical protein
MSLYVCHFTTIAADNHNDIFFEALRIKGKTLTIYKITEEEDEQKKRLERLS